MASPLKSAGREQWRLEGQTQSKPCRLQPVLASEDEDTSSEKVSWVRLKRRDKLSANWQCMQLQRHTIGQSRSQAFSAVACIRRIGFCVQSPYSQDILRKINYCIYCKVIKANLSSQAMMIGGKTRSGNGRNALVMAVSVTAYKETDKQKTCLTIPIESSSGCVATVDIPFWQQYTRLLQDFLSHRWLQFLPWIRAAA